MAQLPRRKRHTWQAPKRKRVGSFSRNPDKRYNSKRWRNFSKTYLKRHPVCVTVGCGKLSNVTDHITPIESGGDFWAGPFQALCHSCHNRKSSNERKNIK